MRRIALQVMSSLETLHRNKIVYCDLCPENIYVCKDESVKLMSYPLIKYIFLSSVKEYLKKTSSFYSPLYLIQILITIPNKLPE